MFMKSLLLPLTFTLLLSGCVTQKTAALKWEYKVVRLDHEKIIEPAVKSSGGADIEMLAESIRVTSQKILEENGKLGWELVATKGSSYIFKRPLVE